MLTQSDLTDIAEILGRRANDVAGFYDDHKGEVRILGSVEMALTREINRLRQLEKAARAAAEAQATLPAQVSPGIDQVRVAGQQLYEELKACIPNDRRCTCHGNDLGTPCSYCVEWGKAHRALDRWATLGRFAL